MTGKSFLAALLFSLSTFTQLFAQCDCVSTGNCPVPINDNGVYNGYLDVTVNGPNDLALNPLQEVCVTITHTWIGDLSISLTSPSGVEYLIMADVSNNYGGCGTQQDNAEICIVPGTGNPLSNNTEYNCNSAPCSVGTCCLNGNWNVPCGGVTSPITSAVQAPNCNLNDFNVAGQPANGTWTISVLDVCNMDVGVLENFSLTFAGGQACYACESDGGVLDSIQIISCLGDSNLILDLPPNYGGSGPDYGTDTLLYGYTYAIVQNGNIIALNTIPNLTGFSPGTYTVYGLSYLLTHAAQLPFLVGMNFNVIDSDLESSTAPFCANFSDNGVPVTILPPIPPTVVNQTICEGDCITVGGQSVCVSDTLTLDSWHGCDSVVQVHLIVINPDTVELVQTICAGACVTVGAQQFCNTTQQYVSLQDWQGCDSVVHLTLNVLSPMAVITPANPPALSCTTNAVALSASSSVPGTFIYQWSGPSSFTSNQATINATVAGTYTVTITDQTNSANCTSTASVTVVSNLVPPDLAYNGAPPAICLGETFDLSSVVITDLNNTNGLISIHTGTPTTPANELANSIVSPTTTTTYYYKATQGNCSDELPITLTVKPLPTANFTATSPSCLNADVTVNYTGSAGPGATYTWFFDGGTAVPGTGQGPHTLTYPFAGTKAISLTVTENGCTSTPFIQNITVESPLAQPVISCTSTTSSVTFTWTAVPGATGYNVTSSVPGTQQTAPSYEVTGLNPGQSVDIQVVAIGTGVCGNSSAQQNCVAVNCPNMTVSVTPVNDICLDTSSSPFNLQVSVTGGNGGGTLSFSGTGIIDPVAGTFDPNQATTGANNITVSYAEGNCSAASNLTINVFPTPTASITATSPVCLGDPAIVSYTGSLSNGQTYNWNFGGGIPSPGNGPGPQNIIWQTAGIQTVTVEVTNLNGCTSGLVAANIQVDAPLAKPIINCSNTTQSVTFTWADVPGATGYDVNVTTGQIATANSPTSYTVNGLSPLEQVSIVVTALGNGACGNNTANATCAAQDCLPVTIAIAPVADICRDASTTSVQLVANVTGGSANGTIEWQGLGVSQTGLFNPNMANIGANTITALFIDGPCSYQQDIVINVYNTPTGGFLAPATACLGSPVSVSFTGNVQPNFIYNWDFGGGTAIPGMGQGPHDVIWGSTGTKTITLTVETPDGCVSPTYTSLVQVNNPVAAPQVTCDSITTTSIEFTWPSVPGATGYSVTTTTGQVATQTGPTTWKVSGLQPLEQVCVTVGAESGSVCPGASTQLCCSALPCPNISVQVAPLADFCLSGGTPPVQLSATVTGSNGTGFGTWSGPGVLNPSTGTFSASAAGIGQHTITYTFVEEACTYSSDITFHVYQQPSASFDLDDVLCLGNSTTVQFTGQAGINAIYTWDFDGGTATPGIGAGPHQVQWSTPGLKTVSLSITDASCASQLFTQQIQVDDQLATPTILCTATTSSVTFTWNSVPNAIDYTVTVINGTGGVPTSDTSFVFSNLSPGQQVAIQVEVNGNTACPLPVVDAACNALPCPTNLTLVISPVTPICLTAASQQVQLSADVDGPSQNGTGTWSGQGIVDPVQGIFDPAVAGTGLHQITYTFQLVNCTYVDNIIIEIVAPPSADAGPDRLLTCWESDQEAQLGGPGTSSGLNITYQWTAASGGFPGEQLVQNPVVNIAGLFTLTVTNAALGCSDSDDVLVMSTQSNPLPEAFLQPLYCNNNGKDAHVTINNVQGGTEPFLYSLNGEPFVTSNTFAYLSEGEYEITVMDAEGCTGTSSFRVEHAGTLDVELTTNLVGQAVVEFGETINLTAVCSLPESDLDSIQWTNGAVLSCTDCLTPTATPLGETTFLVTVFKDGCLDSDSIKVFVELGDSPVYVPNAFSPNGDGVNDFFRIYPGPAVTRVKSFLVFDRWGELVFKYRDFDPKDPARGWDGSLDGRPMNPAVYVWYAEIEFADGSSKIFEGDVTLIR